MSFSPKSTQERADFDGTWRGVSMTYIAACNVTSQTVKSLRRIVRPVLILLLPPESMGRVQTCVRAY